MPPPYLDKYGETDQGLRRGDPLHLCKASYNKWQRLWLSHSVQEHISHAMETSQSLLQTDWHHV
jgi:E3 ubiquitin-protein ligase UBR2